MGKGSEGIAASGDSKNNHPGTSEAHYVRSRSQEDRRVPARTLGEVEGSAEEGGLESDRPFNAN
jgi:hypothetical protein